MHHAPEGDGRRRRPSTRILQLAYAVGCPAESPRLELETLPADEEAADMLWHKLRLPTGSEVVVLNSGGLSVQPNIGRPNTLPSWRAALQRETNWRCWSIADPTSGRSPQKSSDWPLTRAWSEWRKRSSYRLA